MRVVYRSILEDILKLQCQADKDGRTIECIYVTDAEWREVARSLGTPAHTTVYSNLRVNGVRLEVGE
jgi:hypothetical protein